MSLDKVTARRLVLKFLASQKPPFRGQVGHIESGVGKLLAKETGRWQEGRSSDGKEFLRSGDLGDYSMINEVVWDLIVQRVLTLGLNDSNPKWPFLRLTEYGVEVVKEELWSPYDPDGYLSRLAEQAPKLCPLCKMYVAEALSCFNHGCNLATVVMLGAASEAVVLKLFRWFLTAIQSLAEEADVRKRIEKEQSVFRKYEVFRRHFDQFRSKMPPRLTDDLNLQFDGVFNLIRYYRNEAGHPTGTEIEKTSAFTALRLFVPYCRRIEEIGDWFQFNADKLHP